MPETQQTTQGEQTSQTTTNQSTTTSSSQPTSETTKPATTETTKPEAKAGDVTAPKPSILGGEPEDQSTTNKEATDDKGAPEKYETFTVPDGYKLDDAVAGEFSEIAKKMGLSQARAQTLVDFYVQKTQETFNQPFKAWNELQERWANETENHPELRGKLGQVKQDMGRMLGALGDPQLVSDFRKAMDLTGAGNHPAFVRVMAKLTAMFGEGKPVRAGGPSPHGQRAPGAAPTSAAAALYPNLPSSG